LENGRNPWPPCLKGAGIFEERSEEKMTGGFSATEMVLKENNPSVSLRLTAPFAQGSCR